MRHRSIGGMAGMTHGALTDWPTGRTARRALGLAAVAAAALIACLAAPSARAAETGVAGSGTFRWRPGEVALPPVSPFSAADLASGKLSFAIRWDDAATDRDPDPSLGVYPEAVRQFVLRIGDTQVTLPVETTRIEVSDGGQGAVQRETLRVEGSRRYGDYLLTVGWLQVNEVSTRSDLRGQAGALPGDRLPDAGTAVSFKAAGPFDRCVYVTLRWPGGNPVYPIWVQTSAIDVKASAAPIAGTSR